MASMWRIQISFHVKGETSLSNRNVNFKVLLHSLIKYRTEYVFFFNYLQMLNAPLNDSDTGMFLNL